MGLDYETSGAKKSTASKMRSQTADQSGGTDSGDAREAWDRGFDESLDIEDGKTYDDVDASLKAGYMVHLDVWHAAMDAGCISGSGAYGHTIAIVPDHDGSGWLVGDPWCTNGYKRVSTSDLRNGAEEWGRRVYGAARAEPDYPPTGGPRDPIVLVIVARIVKRLMDLSYPGHERYIKQYPETSGAQPILYTRTHARALEGADMGPMFENSGAAIGQATVSIDGANLIGTADGQYHPIAKGIVRNVSAVVDIADGKYAGEVAYLVSIPGRSESGLLLADLADYVANPPSGGSNEERDAEWTAWLLDGAPGT